MSKHTQGKIHASILPHTNEWELIGDNFIRPDDSEVLLIAGGLEEGNARRLAAAWNVCEGIDTESLENGATLVDICERSNGYQFELNAARALLREVKSLGIAPKMWAKGSDTLESRITEYLDACDTLEGK